jgi:hypothetical protein
LHLVVNCIIIYFFEINEGNYEINQRVAFSSKLYYNIFFEINEGNYEINQRVAFSSKLYYNIFFEINKGITK